MLKILLFLRELNWLTISSLFSAFVSVVVAFIPGSPAPVTTAFAGLSISLALLALRD